MCVCVFSEIPADFCYSKTMWCSMDSNGKSRFHVALSKKPVALTLYTPSVPNMHLVLCVCLVTVLADKVYIVLFALQSY